MKMYDDDGKCLITLGDYVLVNPMSILWDWNIDPYEDPLYEMIGESWDTELVGPKDEWYKVTHLFRPGDGAGIQGWGAMGHDFFCLVEVPPESKIYDRFTHPFDTTQSVYGLNMIEHYGVSRELNHGKMIASLFEGFIEDFKRQ